MRQEIPQPPDANESRVFVEDTAVSQDLPEESAPPDTQINATDTQTDTQPKRRGRPFAPGNPGRPQGARNKTTELAEGILAGDAEQIMRVLVKDAVRGHTGALKQCLERLVPRPRERTVSVDLPVVETVEDAARAAGQLTALVGSGELTPRESKTLADVIEAQRRTLAARDTDRRILALEEAVEALRGLVNELLASEIVVPASLIDPGDGGQRQLPPAP